MPRNPEGNWVRTTLLVITGTTAVTVVGFCCVCSGLLSLSKDRTQKQLEQARTTVVIQRRSRSRDEYDDD